MQFHTPLFLNEIRCELWSYLADNGIKMIHHVLLCLEEFVLLKGDLQLQVIDRNTVAPIKLQTCDISNHAAGIHFDSSHVGSSAQAYRFNVGSWFLETRDSSRSHILRLS